MRRTLLILLALCTLSAIAAVPRFRRDINSDQEENGTSNPEETKICAPRTPCKWLVYKQSSKIITQIIINEYCVCASGFVCDKELDDPSREVFTVTCREVPPQS